MAHSTSLASPPEGSLAAKTASLARFYAYHAPIYDWTRPFILYGRSTVLRRLSFAPGATIIDVGCGTGYSLERLARRGARVIGIDSSPAMLRQATRRIGRLALPVGTVLLEQRPYGTHADHAGLADVVLFSYSLSMIPSHEHAISQAAVDLKGGGRLAVVDFLTATNPLVDRWLRANHVVLGRERLDNLRRQFPRHTLEVKHAGLWRYFLFYGDR